jgi:hypothetical protein
MKSSQTRRTTPLPTSFFPHLGGQVSEATSARRRRILEELEQAPTGVIAQAIAAAGDLGPLAQQGGGSS